MEDGRWGLAEAARLNEPVAPVDLAQDLLEGDAAVQHEALAAQEVVEVERARGWAVAMARTHVCCAFWQDAGWLSQFCRSIRRGRTTERGGQSKGWLCNAA